MPRIVQLPSARPFDPWIVCDHPHGVLVAALYAGVPPPYVLAAASAQEHALLKGVPLIRRGQWIAARACARYGLLQIGFAGTEVLATDRGGPVARSGHSMSLSHKAGLAAALIAVVPGLTVGVDVEVPNAWDGTLASKVLTRAEHERARASAAPSSFVLRQFSAKEAVYKAVDPVLRRNVDFGDVEVSPVRECNGYELADVSVRTKEAEPTLAVQVAWLQVGPFLVTTSTARHV